ncbi:MAG: YaaW family protein [Elainellaceae cyanobacterium]
MDELRSGLQLATDDELEALTSILFSRRFNPLDYALGLDPIEVQSRDRQSWLDEIERRFRFLAADGMTVLRRQTDRVSYRQILIQVCRYLKVPYAETFSTVDLEAEIFLHILQRAWKKLPPSERHQLSHRLQQSLLQSSLVPELPASIRQDPLQLVLKGGSALAVSSIIRPWILQHIARQFALHTAQYQLARQTLARGGTALAAQVQQRISLQMAQRGMALSAARYGAVRTVFAVVGPALWTWFIADLGWRAIATNYGRIIPVIFTLAQIRLIRTECYGTAG